MNIYVGNLPYNVGDEELRQMFAAYGEVASAKVITDNYSGRSKGFGFVEMEDNSQADTAIKALNHSRLNEREIKVNQAEAKGKRRSGRGGRGSRRY